MKVSNWIQLAQKGGKWRVLVTVAVNVGCHSKLRTDWPLENCALLRCYAPSGGNLLKTFRLNLSVTFSGLLNSKDRADRLSRNVFKKLPPLAA